MKAYARAFRFLRQGLPGIAGAVVLSMGGCGRSAAPVGDTIVARPAPVSTALPRSTPPRDARSQIKVRYSAWKKTWEGRSLEAFIAFYSPRVRVGTGTGYKGLRQRKQSQWASESYIHIRDLREPVITVRGNTATLVALQDYDSTTWWDRGIKRLTWEKKDGRWLIVRERFTAHDQRSKVKPKPTATAVPVREPFDRSDGELDADEVYDGGYGESDPDSGYGGNYDGDSEDAYTPDEGYDSGDEDDSDFEVGTGACGRGATAVCSDGTLSYSANRRGTCSHHGGVAVWCE